MIQHTAPDAVRELAVVGSPIAHSKSPALHAAAYRVLGLPWKYGRHELAAHDLPEFVRTRGALWRGMSLTMPLKQSVLPLVTSLDATAALTGAANTILFDEQDGARVLRGFNTDVPGIVRALRAAGTRSTRSVLIWGGGATAASALVAAAELGASTVTVQVRRPERAHGLEPLAHAAGVRLRIDRLGSEPEERPDLVMSTLPGTAGDGGAADAIVTGEAVAGAAASGVLLFDVAYDPWPTPIAERWGGAVLSGLAMLAHQALLQVRVFVLGDPTAELPGEPAVLDAMLDAVGISADGRPVTAWKN
jgi:shikimate dehydrogenase